MDSKFSSIYCLYNVEAIGALKLILPSCVVCYQANTPLVR